MAYFTHTLKQFLVFHSQRMCLKMTVRSRNVSLKVILEILYTYNCRIKHLWSRPKSLESYLSVYSVMGRITYKIHNETCWRVYLDFRRSLPCRAVRKESNQPCHSQHQIRKCKYKRPTSIHIFTFWAYD